MSQQRSIYYVAFPLVAAGLCGFSYYLGFMRGKQEASVPARSERQLPKEVHPNPGELTFFKTLKSDETPKEITKPNPPAGAIVKKIEEDQPEVEAKAGSIVVQVSAFRDIG